MAPVPKLSPTLSSPEPEWEEVSTADVLDGKPTELHEPVHYETPPPRPAPPPLHPTTQTRSAPRTVQIRIRQQTVELEESFIWWTMRNFIIGIVIAWILAGFLKTYFPL